MKPVLVVYATREGQTRHIAEHACGRLAAQQFACELVDAAHVPETFALENYAAVIAGASLHRAKHEPEMTAFVRRYLPQLQEIPTLFLSVSLSETTVEDPNAPPEKRDKAREDVKRTIDEFLAETGWRPTPPQHAGRTSITRLGGQAARAGSGGSGRAECWGPAHTPAAPAPRPTPRAPPRPA